MANNFSRFVCTRKESKPDRIFMKSVWYEIEGRRREIGPSELYHVVDKVPVIPALADRYYRRYYYYGDRYERTA